MLTDITILVPTFHRRGYLADCLKGIANNLPECNVIAVSDDDLPPEFFGHAVWQELPYDSGISAKRNAAVALVTTEYALLGCDDFDFSTDEVRKSLIEMSLVLKAHPDIDVVAGRVDGRAYEGFLEYVPGEYVKERPLYLREAPKYYEEPLYVWKIDIAANFFLARTSVLKEIPWDESLWPIGGEHGDWFLDMKAAGKLVVFLPFAAISTMKHDASKQDPRYKEFRNRVWLGHEAMLKKRNIKRWYGFNEEVK